MKPKGRKHRYYENTFPRRGEIVMVKYSELTHFGTIVSLLEYNEIEGMVIHKEISSRSKDLSKSKLQARIGKIDVCVVLSVDEEKSFIDLSRTKVNEDDRIETQKYFQKSKSVDSIFNSLLSNIKSSKEEDIARLYEEVAWRIYNEVEIHPNDAFQIICKHRSKICNSLTKPEKEQLDKVYKIMSSSSFLKIADKNIGLKEEEEEQEGEESISRLEQLYQIISRKFERKIRLLRATVDVECYHQKGILAIKEALKTAEESCGVKIRMFNTPTYSMELKFVGSDEEGEKTVKRANYVIKEVIGRYNGSCSDYHILEA